MIKTVYIKSCWPKGNHITKLCQYYIPGFFFRSAFLVFIVKLQNPERCLFGFLFVCVLIRDVELSCGLADYSWEESNQPCMPQAIRAYQTCAPARLTKNTCVDNIKHVSFSSDQNPCAIPNHVILALSEPCATANSVPHQSSFVSFLSDQNPVPQQRMCHSHPTRSLCHVKAVLCHSCLTRTLCHSKSCAIVILEGP